MRVLVIGAGVIGTVYGAQLAAAGHPVAVLRHGPRTDEVARLGLVAQDVVDHTSQTAPVELVPEAGAGSYDLVLISVWATQLPAVSTTSVDCLAPRPCCSSATTPPDGPRYQATCPAPCT